MKRKDVFELISYAAGKGVQVALTPSATPLLTRDAIFKLKEAGLVRLGISLDGSTPEIHDNFRGLPGAWARTIQAIEWANEAGIPIQVHSTISRHNAHDLDNLCALFEKLAIVMWNVFFLVPVGRGQLGDLLSGEEFEQVFGKIYKLSHRVSFQIKTTEAMHYRRYVAQRMKAEHRSAPENEKTGAVMWRTAGVSDGKGFAFVSHTGEIFPSGFLPITAGNVLRDSLTDVYQNSSLFRSLRDVGQREGKCGICEYQKVCGGSRARAYALTGNYLAEDPRCTYHPHLVEAVEAADALAG
jgi:radical SAM protein with 4Fe4S-binding SPASM domain